MFLHPNSLSHSCPPPPLQVVFSLWCKSKKYACASPGLLTMEYYGPSDRALGVFIEEHFSEEARCLSAGCTEP